MTFSRRLRVLALSACTMGLVVPLAAQGAVRTALQDPAAYTRTYDQPIAPGVDLTGFRSPVRGGITASNVLTVDLDRPGVSTGLLSARVTDVKTVADYATGSGAVAAVNGDYYAISGSGAPQGPEVRGGQLVKALARKRYVEGVGTDGVARRALLWLDGTVRWGSGGNIPVERYNSDLDGSDMPKDSVSVFDASWGGATVGFSRAPAKVSYVLVSPNGKIVKASRRFTPQTVPPGGLLLVGTGRWTSIGALPRHTRVVQQEQAATDAPVPFAWALGGGLELVHNGGAIHNAPEANTDPHAARTAIGWSPDGRTLKVVTVERGPSSVGQSANEIADELLAQGAWEAILLDGGGSTTLEARLRGTNERDQIGAEQDGFQRPVANAIGVFVPKGSGNLAGLDVSSDSPVVFPGLARRIRISPYDEWYGPANIDVSAATLTSVNGFFTQSAPQMVRAGAVGRDTITATVGGITASVGLRILDPLASLVLPDELRIDPGASGTLRVLGLSTRNEQAPIDATDLTLTPAGPAIAAQVGPTGEVVLTAAPGTVGAAVPVTIAVDGISQIVLIRSGYRNDQLPVLGAANAWAAKGARSSGSRVGRHLGDTGLHLLLQPQGATVLKPKQGPIVLAPDAVRIALNVKSDGHPHTVRVLVADALNQTHLVTLGTTGPTKGWTRYEVALPAGSVQLREVRILGPGGPHPGEITLAGLITRS